MRRILIIITGGLHKDGITLTQYSLIKHMDLTGIIIDILAVHSNDKDMIRKFNDLGCDVIVTPDRKRNVFKYCRFISRLIKNKNYDVVHVHGSSYLMGIELYISKKCGVSLRIAHSHNTSNTYSFLSSILKHTFFKSVNYCIACGSDAGNFLFKKRKFIVLHNGNELYKFIYNSDVRNKIRKELCVDNSLVLGCVANFVKQKNISFLLSVFCDFNRVYSNSFLVLIGDGSQKEQLIRKCVELGIEKKVIFTGRVDDVGTYLQAMDIMCLTSFYEGLPNVVLEWQISGLRCLLSDHITKECKITDLIQFLSIDNGTKIWVEALTKLIDFKENREKESMIACSRVKECEFDLETNSVHLKKIYLGEL